jgi:hypothetical protein
MSFCFCDYAWSDGGGAEIKRLSGACELMFCSLQILTVADEADRAEHFRLFSNGENRKPCNAAKS